MSWTQPVCENRFREMYPGRKPHRINRDMLEQEGEPLDRCCFCQEETTIYVRIDPATVPFPTLDE